MKKLATLVIISLISLSTQAKIYRLNNNAGAAARFTSAQTAHDSCAAGDTIYAEGTPNTYGTLNITKKITIIGPGYYLAQNPQTQATLVSALFQTINCNSGSAGTLLTGLDVGVINISDNNIVLKRNRMWGYSSYALNLNSNVSNILVVQNYISNNSYPLSISSGCNNIIVSNNYIEQYSGGGWQIISMSATSAALITNNVIYGAASNDYLTLNNATFNNNILVGFSGAIVGANNSQNNNLSSGAQLDTTGGNVHHNQINVNMANVFVGTGSNDGKYKLKAGSPAIGAGYNSEDCGMFGGSDPYVLSGLPTVPSIYYIAVPTSGYGTLPVHVKIKSNK